MTPATDPPPDMTRPDAGMALFGEWTVGTAERQQAAMDASMTSWDTVAWPNGLLSYTCLASTDGRTLRHHSQWVDAQAPRAFTTADAAVRWHVIDDAVPGIDRLGVAAYERYGSHHAMTNGARSVPGCIVIVDIAFNAADPQLQRDWIDVVLEALVVESPHGLIAAHFHTSVDGDRVVNYAEWTSEHAHRESLDSGTLRADETELHQWRRVRDFPGVTDLTRFTRYPHWRSVTGPPAAAISSS